MSELSKTLSNIRTLLIRSNRLTSESSDEELEQAVADLVEDSNDPKSETSDKTESKPVEIVSKQEHEALKQEVETLKKSVSALSNDLKSVQTDVQTLGKRPKVDASDEEKDVQNDKKKKYSNPALEAFRAKHGY